MVSATTPNTPKGEKFSCRKLYIKYARNATTIIRFIVTAKIVTVIKNIFAESAIINLSLTEGAQRLRERDKLGDRELESIPHVLSAAKAAFFTTTTSITAITAVRTSGVTIPFSFGKTLRLLNRPCLNFLASTISNECVIPLIS